MTATIKKCFLELLQKNLKVKLKNALLLPAIITTVHNINKASNYSDINQLFRATTFVVRFVKNLFQKVKGKNLKIFNYGDVSQINEAKIHWIKANQLLLLKSENYENLPKNLTLKFDGENIIRCYSRLENGNENSYPIMRQEITS